MKTWIIWLISFCLTVPAACMVEAAESAGAKSPATVSEHSIFRDTMVEMTWPQVQQAAKESVLVLVPVGVIEEHGPHMNLGADTYLVCLHCRRIKLALAEAGIKAIIAPPFYWGITDDTSRFPGSFSVRPETMTALVEDICRSLKSWGFQRMVFVSDHGNLNHRQTLKLSLAKARKELNIEAFSLDVMFTEVPVYQAPERPGRYLPDYHAGAAETGVMAKEFPAAVDDKLAETLKPQSEFSPLGYVGDPASFRQETALIDYFVKAPVTDAQRIRAFFSLQTAIPGAGAGRPSVQQIDAQAQALVDHYIQALGGRAKLKTIRNQVRHGKIHEKEGITAIQGIWSNEGKWLFTINPTNSLREQFGYNGFFGWHAERGRVEQLPEPLRVAVSLAVDPQLPLRLERQFAVLGPPRVEKWQARTVKVLEGKTASGLNVVLMFDAETGYLCNFNETTFEDYRETEGVRFPYIVKINPGTEVRYERMEHNVPIEAVQFEPPK